MTTKLPSITHTAYRPDIDGLRAIAVLMVIGFHYFPSRVPFGFIGVDIFFVISGYLITRILITWSLEGNLKFEDFYANRIKRIFPALITVLISCLVFGWFTMLPSEYSQLGKHTAAASIFISNFLLLGESGYFDLAAEVKPLLHLWSLSIEEQFYLIWPLILYCCLTKKWVNLRTLLLLLWIASFAIGIYLSLNYPPQGFYLPISRFWELILGAFLASISSQSPSKSSLFPSQYISAIALSLLILSFWFISKERAYPGYWAIFPTMATFFILLSPPNAFFNRKILSHSALIKIGLISYPLYLWHWPILVFLNFNIPADISKERLVAYKVAAIGLSFILAYLTYRFIELPIRSRKGKQGRTPALISLILLMATGLAGYSLVLTKGAEDRIPKEIRPLLTSKNLTWEHYVRFDSCHLQEDQDYKYPESCFEHQRPLAVLWGDSHASTLYPALASIQNDNHFGVNQFTKAGCPPLQSSDEKDIYCSKNYQEALKNIEKAQPEYIFIHSAWILRPSIYPKSIKELETRLAKTLEMIKRTAPSTKIILVGPLPRWHVNPLRTTYINWITHGDLTVYQPADPMTDVENSLKKIASQNQTEYISLGEIFCIENKCISRVDIGGWELISTDYGHLSKAGAEYLGEKLKSRIQSIVK